MTETEPVLSSWSIKLKQSIALIQFNMMDPTKWAFRHVSETAESRYELHHVCLSVYLSIHMEQLDSHWMDTQKI